MPAGVKVEAPFRAFSLISEPGAAVFSHTLVVLEAMKMEHAVKASEDGVVSELFVSVGQQVEADAPLMVVSAE